MEQPNKAEKRGATDHVDPWAEVEAVRLRRLREQGRRSLDENLAETIVLSRKLAQVRIVPPRR